MPKQIEKDMTNQIELFGIRAELNVIQLSAGLGTLKEINFTCSKDDVERIIAESVKCGYPFERTSDGVKIFK